MCRSICSSELSPNQVRIGTESTEYIAVKFYEENDGRLEAKAVWDLGSRFYLNPELGNVIDLGIKKGGLESPDDYRSVGNFNLKNFEPRNSSQNLTNGASGETRTPMKLPSLDFESSASTNSATKALYLKLLVCLKRLERLHPKRTLGPQPSLSTNSSTGTFQTISNKIKLSLSNCQF